MSTASRRGIDEDLARQWLQKQLLWEQILTALREARTERPIRLAPQRHEDAAA